MSDRAKKITELSALTAPAADDLLVIVDDVAGTVAGTAAGGFAGGFAAADDAGTDAGGGFVKEETALFAASCNSCRSFSSPSLACVSNTFFASS